MINLTANQRLRILVLGYIVRGPIGGLAWHHMQYVMALSRLGHDVYFIEDSDDYPSCYNPVTNTLDIDPSFGIKFTENAFKQVGFLDRWAYYDAHVPRWIGPCANRIFDIVNDADVFLNLSGVNPLRPWFKLIPKRVLVDTDPAFTQIRHLTNSATQKNALGHNVFFTFGENILNENCTIPDDRFPWKPTRQPIVLDAWAKTPGPANGKYTTVMQWDSYPATDYNGVKYDMKSASFEDYKDMPHKTGRALEIALGSATAPRQDLIGRGWMLRNPLEITKTPWTYQSYIKQSKAEFSVAKHGYVVSRSGWFSERSACYLASGRPVLTQETGFTDWLKADAGVISFKTTVEAVAGIKEIDRDYDFHCEAARSVAMEYFDSSKVLNHLIDEIYKNDE